MAGAPTTGETHWQTLTRSWRYVPSGRRDLRLDFLRGYCAFAMVVDHLGGASYLYPITGGNQFFISAAEGFIFLSGLLVGLIYGPRAVKESLATVQLHLLRRAATLYTVTMGLTFVFIGLSRLTVMSWLPEVEPLTPELVAGIITLHRTYYLVDVMLLYTILLGISPLAMLLLYSRKTGLLLLLSVGLWLTQQAFPQQAEVPWPIANNPTFPIAAWQLWFFGGVIVGYHQEAIWSRLARVPRRPALIALLLGVVGLVYLRFTNGDRLAGIGGLIDGTAALDLLFEKGNARVGRIVAFAIFFPFLYALLTYIWRPIAGIAGWLLIPFGQYALYVYVLHLFVVYLAALLLPLVPGFDRLTPWMNTPVHVVGILALWLFIRHRVLFDLIPR